MGPEGRNNIALRPDLGCRRNKMGEACRWMTQLQRIDKEWRLYQKDQLIGQFKTRREAERQLAEWGRSKKGRERQLLASKWSISLIFPRQRGQPLPEYEVPV